jgi:hypothetical protein
MVTLETNRELALHFVDIAVLQTKTDQQSLLQDRKPAAGRWQSPQEMQSCKSRQQINDHVVINQILCVGVQSLQIVG